MKTKAVRRRRHERRMLEAALKWAKRGVPVFPLDGKEPFKGTRGFHDATKDPAQIRSWWRDIYPGANIGAPCGPASGLVIIDYDKAKKENRELPATKWPGRQDLPETCTVETRPGHLHHYFRIRGGLSIKRHIRPFQRGKRPYAVDVLGEGGYAVLPPSVHPETRKPYRILNPEVPIRSLPRAVEKALRKALKKRSGPRRQGAELLPPMIYEGERDKWLTSYAGTLRRRGLTWAEIEKSLRVINEERVRPMKAPKDLHRIAQSIGKKESAEVAYKALNAAYGLIQVGSKIMVLQRADGIPRPHDKAALPSQSREYTLLTVEAFHHKHANDFVIVETKPGRPHSLQTSKGWFAWAGRREYDRLVFKPGDEHVPPNEFNVWRGWAVEPNEAGSCDRFLTHLRDIVVGGNEAHYEWLLDWMADLFQHPQRRPGTGSAVALLGAPGSGKSIVGVILKRLLGPHHKTIDKGEHVTGRFNAHFEGCLLLQIEEAFWAGDRSKVGTLKHMVTGESLSIERKGVDPVEMPNYMRLLITSNEDWAWPTDMDDRRLAAFDVKSTHARDKKYFEPLFAELEAGGYGRLLRFLLDRGIDSARLDRIPRTAALEKQALHTISQKPEEVWLMEWLERGTVPKGAVVDHAGRVHLWTALLYSEYVQSLTSHGRAITAAEFGLFLSQRIPKVRDVKPQITKRWAGAQAERRVLPSLSDCRLLYANRGRAAPQKWRNPTKQQWKVERV